MRNLTLFWALVFSVFISFSGTALAASASSSDLWDISQGAIVVGNSTVHPVSDIGNMFGGTAGSKETDKTLFVDGFLEGKVHSVEWQTPNLVTLEGFNLLAQHGASPDYTRMFDEFRLYCGDGQAGWTEIYSWNLDGTTYGGGDDGRLLELEIYFDPADQVTAQYFKAEFDQKGNHLGPRIIELDGYGATGAPVPVPGAVWLLGTGLISLAGIRRRSTML